MLEAGSFMLGCSEHELATVVRELGFLLVSALGHLAQIAKLLSPPPRCAHICTEQGPGCSGLAAPWDLAFL